MWPYSPITPTSLHLHRKRCTDVYQQVNLICKASRQVRMSRLFTTFLEIHKFRNGSFSEILSILSAVPLSIDQRNQFSIQFHGRLVRSSARSRDHNLQNHEFASILNRGEKPHGSTERKQNGVQCHDQEITNGSVATSHCYPCVPDFL